MKEYQERVVAEKADNDMRATALANYVQGEQFEGLPPSEQMRMTRQLKIMAQLSNVLNERIIHFIE